MKTDDYSSSGIIFNTDTSGYLDDFDKFKPETYKWSRPTVAAALMKSSQLLLVQSSKGGSSRTASWILPQGGVDQGRTIYEGLSAELWQELGLEYDASTLLSLKKKKALVVLGAYTNAPRENGDLPKLIVVIGMQLGKDFNEGSIVLNEENTKMKFVSNEHQLWSMMANNRPRKVIGTAKAVSVASSHNLLPWTCDNVVNNYPHGFAA